MLLASLVLAILGPGCSEPTGTDDADGQDGLEGEEASAGDEDDGPGDEVSAEDDACPEDGGDGEEVEPGDDGFYGDEDETSDGESGEEADWDDGDGDGGLPCPEQQPHEHYCINPLGNECDRLTSFCREGTWQCSIGYEFPPPMPEFEDWAWRCGVYHCSVPAIAEGPGVDWQDNPLEPYVPPDPAGVTGEWVELADLSDTVPPGCERQPRTVGLGETLVVSPTDPRIMYAGFRTDYGEVMGVWKSVDGGESWFEARGGLGSEGCDWSVIGECHVWAPVVRRLYVDPEDPDLVFASTMERNLYRSEDGGRSWWRTDLPDWCGVPEAMGPVLRAPDGVYHTACGEHRFESRDRGQTWERMSRINDLQHTPQYTAVLVLDPARPGRIWAGMSQSYNADPGGGWVYLSEDNGSTWEARGDDIEAECHGRGYLQSLSFCQADPDLMAMSIIYCGLFLSRDGGQSWGLAPGPLDTHLVTWSQFAPSDTDCLLYASHEDAPTGIHRSADGGLTWETELAQIPLDWLFFNPYDLRLVVGLSRSSARGSFEVWERR